MYQIDEPSDTSCAPVQMTGLGESRLTSQLKRPFVTSAVASACTQPDGEAGLPEVSTCHAYCHDGLRKYTALSVTCSTCLFKPVLARRLLSTSQARLCLECYRKAIAHAFIKLRHLDKLNHGDRQALQHPAGLTDIGGTCAGGLIPGLAHG